MTALPERSLSLQKFPSLPTIKDFFLFFPVIMLIFDILQVGECLDSILYPPGKKDYICFPDYMVYMH